MIKTLILAMNYGTANEIVDYAGLLAVQTVKSELCLMVVDNKFNSEDNLEKKLKNVELNIIYYNPNKNLGYLNGALFGIDEFVRLNGYVPQWLAISNTDILFEGNDFFERFLSTQYADDVWCVAPSITSPQGRFCNPHYSQRVPLTKVNRIISILKHPYTAKIYYKLAAVKASMHKGIPQQESQYVYSSHGCFFILKSTFYETLKGEKYGVLLYSEESFIAEFILENNKKSYYDANLSAIHCENLVTGKINYKVRGKYISESMKYIKERFYSEGK